VAGRVSALSGRGDSQDMVQKGIREPELVVVPAVDGTQIAVDHLRERKINDGTVRLAYDVGADDRLTSHGQH
jgi:hypothetical protein